MVQIPLSRLSAVIQFLQPACWKLTCLSKPTLWFKSSFRVLLMLFSFLYSMKMLHCNTISEGRTVVDVEEMWKLNLTKRQG
ncbi:hypothetical protein HanRHA438_Chr01g0003001 [Helianthus annuus]|nr:hypothetical protein HanRHA438_Chr01g0003001 [Helianthus annuus]